MVSYQELNDLRLGKLKQAVTDWEQMADKLAKLAEGGDGGTSAAGLEKKANGADWKGQNATVTKGFVVTTAGEFDDAVTAARSIHTILSGARTELAQHKQDLKETVDRAAKKKIHVTAKGVVEPVEGADPQPTQAEIDGVAGEITKVLEAAAATDKTAAAALRHHAKEKYNFRSEGFKSFDAAQKAVEDSDEFNDLAKKDPSELTNTQLNRLNTLATQNAGDPVFAERVATGLGPEGTLKFFSGAVSMNGWEGSRDAREARMKLLGGLEENLGRTLGTATRADSNAMDSWQKRVIELGGTTVEGTDHHKNVRGFQAMSNLMRHGKYDGEFLNDYGDALVKYEKEHTGDVRDPGPGGRTRENVLPWDALPSYSQVGQLHYGEGNDAGTDPMTGFMKGLANNPDASSEFFSATEPQDNSRWVLKDRPSFNDVVMEGYNEDPDDYEGPKPVNDAIGDALVAGASGQDPHNPQPHSGEHTPQQRAVLENSVKYLSERENDFPAELRDDMAKVLISHGGTVHGTMGASGGDTPLDKEQLMEVSKQVSRDQNAYGTLNEGLNYAILEDFQNEKDRPEDSLDRAGRTVGFLEEARYQAIGDKADEDLDTVGWEKNWAYHGLGGAANFIPGVGDTVQRGVDLVATDWMQNEQDRIDRETVDDNKSTYEQREKHLNSLAERWHEVNADWAKNETGYSADQGIYSRIKASANDGNDNAEGVSGDQE